MSNPSVRRRLSVASRRATFSDTGFVAVQRLKAVSRCCAVPGVPYCPIRFGDEPVGLVEEGFDLPLVFVAAGQQELIDVELHVHDNGLKRRGQRSILSRSVIGGEVVTDGVEAVNVTAAWWLCLKCCLVFYSVQ